MWGPPCAFLNLPSSSRFQSGQTLLTLMRRKWRRGSCLITVSFMVVVFLHYALPVAATLEWLRVPFFRLVVRIFCQLNVLCRLKPTNVFLLVSRTLLAIRTKLLRCKPCFVFYGCYGQATSWFRWKWEAAFHYASKIWVELNLCRLLHSVSRDLIWKTPRPRTSSNFAKPGIARGHSDERFGFWRYWAEKFHSSLTISMTMPEIWEVLSHTNNLPTTTSDRIFWVFKCGERIKKLDLVFTPINFFNYSMYWHDFRFSRRRLAHGTTMLLSFNGNVFPCMRNVSLPV